MPAPFVPTTVCTPVAWSVIVTLASATSAPLASVTTPVMTARSANWPNEFRFPKQPSAKRRELPHNSRRFIARLPIEDLNPQRNPSKPLLRWLDFYRYSNRAVKLILLYYCDLVVRRASPDGFRLGCSRRDLMEREFDTR